MAANGWLKVPKAIVERYASEPDKLVAYMDLKMRADYDTGSVNVTVKGLALKHGWSRDKARRFIGELPTLDRHLAIHLPDTQADTLKTRPVAPLRVVTDTPTDISPTPGNTLGRHIPKKVEVELDNNTPHKPPKGGEPYSAEFLKFWNRYPKRVGKGAAWRAWKRIRPPLDSVFDALAWQEQSDSWRVGYVPHPATYLNQRRWEDEKPVVPESQVQAYDAIWGEKK